MLRCATIGFLALLVVLSGWEKGKFHSSERLVGGKTEAQTGGCLGGTVPQGAQSDGDVPKNSMMVPGV